MVVVSGILGLAAGAVLVAGVIAGGASGGALFYASLIVGLIAVALLPLGAARRRGTR